MSSSTDKMNQIKGSYVLLSSSFLSKVAIVLYTNNTMEHIISKSLMVEKIYRNRTLGLMLFSYPHLTCGKHTHRDNKDIQKDGRWEGEEVISVDRRDRLRERQQQTPYLHSPHCSGHPEVPSRFLSL